MAANDQVINGWSAVPVRPSQIFRERPYINKLDPLLVKDLDYPSENSVVSSIQNSSTRPPVASICYRSAAVPRSIIFSSATLALTCLLHDLGTTQENMSARRMSFEFHGAIKSLNLLQQSGASTDQAEAVVEAIIRHQYVGVVGKITFFGQTIQLATICDNVGAHPTVENLGELVQSHR
ncbi:hypothetical protein S40288_04690 [Stachybotrys chartarum IBT 40288]|nr:hypothetical protein S40288_04690 [Stachybotrys chartarum IBT 40288]